MIQLILTSIFIFISVVIIICFIIGLWILSMRMGIEKNVTWDEVKEFWKNGKWSWKDFFKVIKKW